MVSEMVERVARQMALATNGGNWDDPLNYTKDQQKWWRMRAKAAIAAMREPTNDMTAAGHSAQLGEAKSLDLIIYHQYRAMIDVALKP